MLFDFDKVKRKAESYDEPFFFLGRTAMYVMKKVFDAEERAVKGLQYALRNGGVENALLTLKDKVKDFLKKPSAKNFSSLTRLACLVELVRDSEALRSTPELAAFRSGVLTAIMAAEVRKKPIKKALLDATYKFLERNNLESEFSKRLRRAISELSVEEVDRGLTVEEAIKLAVLLDELQEGNADVLENEENAKIYAKFLIKTGNDEAVTLFASEHANEIDADFRDSTKIYVESPRLN